MLEFDEWLDENYDELYIQAAETGEDRELDFDMEKMLEREYALYIMRGNFE